LAQGTKVFGLVTGQTRLDILYWTRQSFDCTRSCAFPRQWWLTYLGCHRKPRRQGM